MACAVDTCGWIEWLPMVYWQTSLSRGWGI